jgi:aspartyl protease family protein
MLTHMIRLLLIGACIVLVAGGYTVRFIDRALNAPPVPKAAVAQVDEPRAPVHSGRTLTLNSGRNGHFEAEARISGRPLDFIVDTGASLVILRASDAARINIRPMRSEYTAIVSTANGKINAARATLDRVEVGGITVFDVSALVLPDEALSRNLLGMSFLSKLRRYEVANGRLVLEQ